MSVKNRRRIFADMRSNLTGQIIDIFKSKLDWTVYYDESNQDKNHGNHNGQLQINTDQAVIHLVCEIKKSVVPSSIVAIKQTIEERNTNVLQAQGIILLANYISTKARKLLVENKINFADTGGNIFIKYEDIHVQIETGQSDRSALSKEGGRAFTKAGLKVLYQFFRSEKLRDLNDKLVHEAERGPKADINSPYKNISEQADVSKDTVSKVIHDLLEQGYILRKSKTEYAWRDKKAVFERWVIRINEVLRPSLSAKRYRLKGEPIEHVNIPDGYQLGGYQGAERWLTLDPSQQIINPPYLIYTHKGYQDLLHDLKVIPDPRGNVIVIEAFWKDDSNISPSADFPVLYADLINSEDPRMMEVAHLIYKNYLHDKL